MVTQRDYLREVEDGRLRETELVTAGEEILDRARQIGQMIEERVRRITPHLETRVSAAGVPR